MTAVRAVPAVANVGRRRLRSRALAVVLALLERWTRRARAVWLAIAVGVLMLSFLPLTAPGTPVATRLVLGSMHLAVAAVLVPAFLRAGPAR